MARREWTGLLKELPVGEHEINFPDIRAIKSCKAIAYDLNSDKSGKNYRFNVNKTTLTCKIIVSYNE